MHVCVSGWKRGGGGWWGGGVYVLDWELVFHPTLSGYFKFCFYFGRLMPVLGSSPA